MIFRIPTIIVFDRKSEHLHRFNLKDKVLTKMIGFNYVMKERFSFFTAVFLENVIYVLTSSKAMFRFKNFDVTSTWERIEDLIQDHGLPPTVAADGKIYVAGAGEMGTPNSFVSKYDPLIGWKKMKEKNISTKCLHSSSIVRCGSFIYNVGGCTRGFEATNRVERMNLFTEDWEEIPPMKEARAAASSAAYNEKLFVLGGYRGANRGYLNFVENFNPETNQWTTLQPMKTCRCEFRTFAINGKLLVVPYDGETESYEVANEFWETIELPQLKDMFILDSVLVNASSSNFVQLK